ncbi:unnamed protein product [Paramecium pentaurelia]|uniref:PUM-HD domain-containing protein n=1 Tax=Paramecium pentaurelia TaxID=43138 RepID=A0A8S1TRC5_9CILI|nr:unnamed protein product [Paramecium pentaurelia]
MKSKIVNNQRYQSCQEEEGNSTRILKNSNDSIRILTDIQLPQQMSKSIQDAYEKGEIEMKNNIFDNIIKENIIGFSIDIYNHYIIQCILEKGLSEHKSYILRLVIDNMEQFCYRKYAYKVVQACLIQFQNSQIIQYIIDNLKKLQFDQYGNLIISTLLDTIQNDVQFAQIINKLQIDKIKYHQYGCVILINMITCPKANHVGPIINKLILESIQLSKSQFSNYIIQKMLKERTIEQNKLLINEYLIPNFIELSCNKFGSNVCEIMVTKSLAYQLQNLWNLVIKQNLRLLLNNEYANYVMQRYYAHIMMFNYILDEFQQSLFEMNKKQLLNQNGKIVYRFVNQCNQVVQQYQQY